MSKITKEQWEKLARSVGLPEEEIQEAWQEVLEYRKKQVNGAEKEPLTDKEAERLALSAAEEHEIMVAQNKENEKRSANLSNSQQ